MAEVKIYSTATCPVCEKAKACLTKWNIPYDEARVDQSQADLKEMLEKPIMPAQCLRFWSEVNGSVDFPS